MKLRLLFLLLLIGTGVFAQNADTLFVLSSPQFSNPFYESYSRNFTGAEAAGRGYTGAAVLSSASGSLINPAALKPDSAAVFTEIGIKPPLDEDNLPFNSNYTSTSPLGLFGFNFPLSSKLSVAAMYSNPKSISLESFSIVINQGAWMVERTPKYYLHQFSGIASYRFLEGVNLGLSLHNQIHYIDDPIFLRSYDRVERSRYALRVQPGVLLMQGPLMFGASATLPAEIDWDLRYAHYQTTLPLELTGGFSYTNGPYRLAADLGFINDSVVDNKFSDRYSLHLGAEQRDGNRIVRAGYMYRSNVWNGELMLPVNTSATADSSMFWDAVVQSLPIKDNSQHFLTVGLSYLFKQGQVNISALQSIVGDNRQTQINLGLSVKLSTFGRKELPNY